MSEEHTRYSMILEWDPRDSIFVVTVPELPGCRTHGKTYEEAVKQGQEAIEGWTDAARAWGDPVPPPRIYTDRAHEQAKASTARVWHG
jgi:predicted RNase H-like HicB family nuclease